MARHQVEFANIVVRSGERELLDLFDDLVWPAIADKQLVRSYGESRYFIDDSRGLVDYLDGVLQTLVAARLVKTTKLKREQYYDRQKHQLVENDDELETAPSGIFLLVANSHKLVYFHETGFAPPLSQLENVLRLFIRWKHNDLIRAQYTRRREQGDKITLTALFEDFPTPTVEIIPLSSESSLSDFIDTFNLLRKIDVRLVKPNSEIHLGPFFEMAQKQRDLLKSAQTTIIQKNTVDGLSKTEAKIYLGAATSQGNARAKLEGLDDHGDKMSGDNENFSIKTTLGKIPKYLGSKGRKLFGEFSKLVDAGKIILTAETTESDKKALEIAQQHGWVKNSSEKDGDDGPVE